MLVIKTYNEFKREAQARGFAGEIASFGTNMAAKIFRDSLPRSNSPLFAREPVQYTAGVFDSTQQLFSTIQENAVKINQILEKITVKQEGFFQQFANTGSST